MIRKILILLFSLKPLRRIIPSLIRKLSFTSAGNTIFLNDFKINLFLTSSIDREIYLKNEYEKEQLNFVKKFKLKGVPTTIIINKKGEEFARIIGEVDFMDKEFLNWLAKYD